MKNLVFLLFIMIFNISFSQQTFDEKEILKFQTVINSEYADPKTSPLEEKDLKNFTTLDFYPISAEYFVNAKFVKATNEKVFKMKTSTARTPEYIKYGTVYFTIDDVPQKLFVYQNVELSKTEKYKNHLFLPFSDKTSGDETYIGGRYIDLVIPSGDEIAIDFNQAYNPFCAYNHKYSCPIVPLDNDLSVAIKAGVKKFHE
jgi:uncharacterized protein (DUF1684 family)